MSKQTHDKKVKIEHDLLQALNNLDEATGSLLALGTDNDEHNATIVMQCKTKLKRVLQQYDYLARQRESK